MSSLFFRAVDVIVGPLRPGTGEHYTPLLRTDDLEDEEYLDSRKAIVMERAAQLVACNLEVYENYFKLATAIVTSRHSWKDTRLRENPEGCRPMKDYEYESFRRDDGPTIWSKLRNQPGPMKWLIFVCGLGAMVQGWDEAAVNGAQVYYRQSFDLGWNDPRIGYINGAPYACCLISCWLSWPLNNLWGRRMTIFLASLCSAGFALAQAFAKDWETMLILRALLGMGIGPKSVTIPVFASEVAPAELRGALVMVFQLFTALGIMLGYLSGVIFANVSKGNDTLLNHTPCSENRLLPACTLSWRLMIASPVVAPVCLCFLIFMQPESPRWLISKAQHKQDYNEKVKEKNMQRSELELFPPKSIDLLPVFKSLVRLRGDSKLKAARDMLNIDVLLWEQRKKNYGWEESLINGTTSKEDRGAIEIAEDSLHIRLARALGQARKEIWLLFSKTRNYNALIASLIVMILQQYCGINVLIYYSTLVLFQAKPPPPLDTYQDGVPVFIVQSCVVGLINFIFGLPAMFLIDHRGRRTLLLRTFPLLAISSALVAIGNRHWPDDSSHFGERLILAGMYLFLIFYSPGEGPVPFVYASESFPQDIRDLGMSVVTSLNWAFNFAVAVTYPQMSDDAKLGRSGTFAFYSSMCFLGFWLIYFFVPETCQKELELLDEVFEENLMSFARKNFQRIFARRSSAKHSDSESISRPGSRGRRPTSSSSSGQDGYRNGYGSRPSSESIPISLVRNRNPQPPRAPRNDGTSPIRA